MPAVEASQGLRLTVRITPRSSRSRIAGLDGDTLKVQVQAPPVEGAANAELVTLLARALRVGRADVRIVAGARGRTKIVEIGGGDRELLWRRLAGEVRDLRARDIRA